MKKFYKDLENKRRIIIDFIKKNPNATTKEIKVRTGVKVERAFRKGIKEAYNLANIKLPKHLLKRDRNFCKKLVIDFIKKNSNATTKEIQSKLKVNIVRLFGSIEKAYQKANTPYTRKEKFDKLRIKIMSLIKNNPIITPNEIKKKTGSDIYSLFKNLKEAYNLANVKVISFREKRRIRKQMKIIEYIKKNPNATQWEINKACNTHVQEIFSRGIREAFERAKISYPSDRRSIYGIAKKKIKHRSMKFENDILNSLNNIGMVKPHVKTASGIVDAILTTKKGVYVIEIKDYRSKPISHSEIEQLNRYLTDLNHRNGIIICNRKNEKYKFQIGSHRIMIMTKDEILKGVVV